MSNMMEYQNISSTTQEITVSAEEILEKDVNLITLKKQRDIIKLESLPYKIECKKV